MMIKMALYVFKEKNSIFDQELHILWNIIGKLLYPFYQGYGK